MPLDPEAQALLDTLAAGPEIDPFSVPPAVMREGLKALARGERGPELPRIEMRADDLAALPSATVLTAEYDPLRDEGRAYAERLQKAGVETNYTNYPGVVHGFFGMTQAIPRARQAVDESCEALRRAFRA